MAAAAAGHVHARAAAEGVGRLGPEARLGAERIVRQVAETNEVIPPRGKRDVKPQPGRGACELHRAGGGRHAGTALSRTLGCGIWMCLFLSRYMAYAASAGEYREWTHQEGRFYKSVFLVLSLLGS